jgi:Zn/Cd-binding protein ZinT
MKRRKFASLFLALALVLSLLAGCGNTSNSTSETQQPASTVTDESAASVDTEQESEVDENQAAAEQLLLDLEGTYQELWPVVLADEYHQVWLDASAELVSEENAEAAVEKMTSMVTGTVTGEEAVEAYKDGNMAYCCDFLQNTEQFTFDGTTISGVDASGNELFSHSYHYVSMEEIRGLYIYESDDADSGEFTYFCMAPDTMETTQHIEFRYGSDLDALGQYDAGDYAYWLASGISVDYTEEDVQNCITLFCTENLSE